MTNFAECKIQEASTEFKANYAFNLGNELLEKCFAILLPVNMIASAKNHESERDSNISAFLSLSSFRAKTQRIPDTWDGTLKNCHDLPKDDTVYEIVPLFSASCALYRNRTHFSHNSYHLIELK